ncbi:hypothetical protein [Magnetospirillum sulfuroxidans]|uniref:Uncharacterized protein n=1 Tax=Magnetospirillum sulfuroxidans TaxID=611300 RepID=A0ABS5IDP2_9PROT|nr:hypothetical protein [Magnetospirillum sulfuroxidans]MBR9972297.1 hypothetical protein [Magnetospirillum sulfuroxidans]
MTEIAASPIQHAPRRKWVWWSRSENAEGCISLFALAEIPFATLLFGWLAQHNPWPWTSLIGLMAAPILLLRSETSVEMGVEMLWDYWERFEQEKSVLSLGKRGPLLGGALAAALLGAAIVLGFDAILPYQTAWEFGSAYIAVLGWTVLIIGISISFAISPNFETVLLGGVAALSVGSVVFGGLTGSVLMSLGLIVAVPLLILMAFLLNAKKNFSTLLLLAPSIILGVFGRAVVIRLRSSLTHLHAGLAALPDNWRTTVVVMDPIHLPELLPRAGDVLMTFSLVHFRDWPCKGEWSFKFLLAAIIYLSALVYRWNIKASWWLWGPVALMLRPAIWERDEDMRVETAEWAHAPSWYGFGFFLLIVLAGLGFLNLPEAIFGAHKDLILLLKSLAPPAVSVRSGLIVACMATTIAFFMAARRLREPYDSVLKEIDGLNKASAGSLVQFRSRARTLRHCRQMLTALMIFTIWSFALKFALERWPEQTGQAVWEWIRPWL